jgi:mRNA-degrading endonuclease RelE of RelBE toxin-antitoxin system
MKFLFTPTAEQHFERLPQQIRKRIASKMRFYEGQPDPLQFAEPLTDRKATASALAITE